MVWKTKSLKGFGLKAKCVLHIATMLAEPVEPKPVPPAMEMQGCAKQEAGNTPKEPNQKIDDPRRLIWDYFKSARTSTISNSK